MHDLDRTWVEEFTMQMSIQQADSDEIDRALVDVRMHCSDSGQSAYDAFGDARHYATTLAAELPPTPQQAWRDPRRVAVLLPLLWGLVALQVALWAPQGDGAPISLGHLLLASVAVPAWVVLTAPWMRRRPRDLRRPDRPAFDEQGWRPVWLAVGLAAVAVALWLGFDQILFTVSKSGLLVTGVTLLVIGASLLRLLARRRASRV
jgi:hypothetical protein